MGRQAKHRNAILGAAAQLFRERGYAATGVADILARSGAPKGSLYHHFEGGKEQLGAEAVRAAGQVVTDTLQSLLERSRSNLEFLTSYFDLLVGWVEQSNYGAGCPVATILLETSGDSAAIRSAGADVLRSWEALINVALDAKDDSLGSLTISTVEGALLQARVLRSSEPLHIALSALRSYVDRD